MTSFRAMPQLPDLANEHAQHDMPQAPPALAPGQEITAEHVQQVEQLAKKRRLYLPSSMDLVTPDEALKAEVLKNAMLNDIASTMYPRQNPLANADAQLNPALQHVLQEIRDDLQVVKTDVQVVKTDLQVVKTDLQVVKTDVQALTNNLQVVQTDVQELKSTSELLRAQMSNISIRLHNKKVWSADPQAAPNLRPLKKYIPDDEQPDDQQPDDEQPDDQQPDNEQPDDQQPDDEQPDDQQPDPGVPHVEIGGVPEGFPPDIVSLNALTHAQLTALSKAYNYEFGGAHEVSVVKRRLAFKQFITCD